MHRVLAAGPYGGYEQQKYNISKCIAAVHNASLVGFGSRV